VQDVVAVDRLRAKLEALEPTPTRHTLASTLVGRLAVWFTELSMRLRAPVQKTEA
jgi:hypothetical protein